MTTRKEGMKRSLKSREYVVKGPGGFSHMKKATAGTSISSVAASPGREPRINDAIRGKVKYQTWAVLFTPPVKSR